jgi:uncharacterized protein YicC (UPF0701 family)
MSDQEELKGEEIPDEVLLKDGLFALDKALESLMEMKSIEGKVLSQLVYNALAYGERIESC